MRSRSSFAPIQPNLQSTDDNDDDDDDTTPSSKTHHHNSHPKNKLVRRIRNALLIIRDSSQPIRLRLFAMMFLIFTLLLTAMPLLSLSRMIQRRETTTKGPEKHRQSSLRQSNEKKASPPQPDRSIITTHPIIVNEPDNNPHRHIIPNILIFTHHTNLLQQKSTSSFDDETQILAKNVRNTISLHPNPTQIRFLTDDDCIAILNQTPGFESLATHFQNEPQGMYKADLCRGAALYQTGGLYFDVDLQARLSIWDVLQTDVQFVTVRVHRQSHHTNCFFNAFVGVTPHHPIIRRYLEMFLEYYEKKRMVEGPLGVILLKRAYDDVTEEDREKSVIWQEVRYDSRFFTDVEPTVGLRRACHFVVAIPRTKIVVFYSRVKGSRMCGGKESLPERMRKKKE